MESNKFSRFNVSSTLQIVTLLVLLSVQFGISEKLKYFQSPNGVRLESFLQTQQLKINLNNSTSSSSKEKLAENLVNSIFPWYIVNFLKNETIQGKLVRALQQPNENTTCGAHLDLLYSKLREIILNPIKIIEPEYTWALHMIDSWGKFPEGILSGHLNAYGDWDECVKVTVDEGFNGKYCWMYILPNIGQEIGKTSGIEAKGAGSVNDLLYNILHPISILVIPSSSYCVPSTCSAEQIQAFANVFYQEVLLNALIPFVYFCNEKTDLSPDSGTKAMIGVLSALLLLVLVGSILDVILNYQDSSLKKNTSVKVLMAFSLPTNIKKWQNTSSGEGGFACIHGIRFLSTAWVLLSHTVYMLTVQGPPWNTLDANNVYARPWHWLFIMNGFFAVDTFFAMSGLLACYSICKALDRSNGRINIFKLYLHRYLRLTPTYGLIIGVLANLIKYFGSGPFFITYAEGLAKSCRKNWWHNLLYFNNLANYDATQGDGMCEGESWYIANDMQFFIISPLFVFLLWKWKRIGMAFLGCASIASILTPGIAIGTEKLPPTSVFWKMGDRGYDVYIQPWYRFGPYAAGIWMGFLLYKIGKKPVKLPKLAVIGAWMTSTSIALALILGIMPYFDPNNDDNAVGAGIYGGLSKFVWGMVICWIIFACVKGYGGWINALLSWRVFIPLGRLSFCVYLSSISVQTMYHLTLRQPMVFDMYHLTNNFFSHLIMCFIVGFLLSMIFESPFIALQKIILGGGGGQGGQPQTKQVTENGTPNPTQISTIPRIKPTISDNASVYGDQVNKKD